MAKNIDDKVLKIIKQEGSVDASRIKSVLNESFGVGAGSSDINSLLYGTLRDRVTRDKNEKGFPVWRLKGAVFEAAVGLESMFYKTLVNEGVLNNSDSMLDFEVKNNHNNKTYHLDIAIFRDGKKYDIEVDGFEHIRADAMFSIQRQIKRSTKNCEIEIDWMDNDNSFVDFKKIDNRKVYKWLNKNREWCNKFHEELIKPHDITRNVYLIENRWIILRFWNYEIKDDLRQCVDDVREVIEK